MAENNSTDALLAFLLGAAAGAVAGLLLAPRSGEETRERLADWLKERRERLGEAFDESREKLQERIHHKKGQVGAAIEAAKQAYRQADEA